MECLSSLPCGDGQQPVQIRRYAGASELDVIMALMGAELSEPYSIFTFRHFLEGWPELCFVAYDGARLVGAIVNKAELRPRTGRRRGYVAMLAVEKAYRRHGLGRRLAATGLQAMCEVCDEVRALVATKGRSGGFARSRSRGGSAQQRARARTCARARRCHRHRRRPPAAPVHTPLPHADCARD